MQHVPSAHNLRKSWKKETLNSSSTLIEVLLESNEIRYVFIYISETLHTRFHPIRVSGQVQTSIINISYIPLFVNSLLNKLYLPYLNALKE